MGWIDVAIPGAAGMVSAPSLIAKSTGDANRDASNAAKLRGLGALLLVVAAVYLLLKIVRA